MDDNAWLPIRDFVVELKAVVEGQGIIGKLYWCQSSVVDDDIFPSKIAPHSIVRARNRVVPAQRHLFDLQRGGGPPAGVFLYHRALPYPVAPLTSRHVVVHLLRLLPS